MTIAVLQLVVGLIILSLGGHYIVKGSIAVALLAHISTAVVGLTVVAFGTSLPELAVSLNAASANVQDISYANVVGSNIFNLAVILALVAIVRPVAVSPSVLRLQYPGMMAIMVAGVVVADLGREISRTDGILLTVGLVTFIGVTVYLARLGRAAEIARQYTEEINEEAVGTAPLREWGISLVLIAIGIAGLWFGADLMVTGAVTIAETMGVSERIIGLTIIAMGTSLPELAASVAASRHGDSAIILGNLLGSNIFNVLAILGITAMVYPLPVNPRAVALDNWVMLGIALALLPMLRSGRTVSRLDGAILLAGFFAYFAVLLTVG